MQELVNIILDSGRTAVDLALYLLLPVMVVMMALMKVLEAKGVLDHTARLLSPPLRLFGVPGNGVFAMLQLLLVSFAAPVATLAVMDRDGTAKRYIAATLAMVLAMPQANVIFPMAAVGLNLPAVVFISLVGGLAAAAATFFVFTRSLGPVHDASTQTAADSHKKRSSLWNLMIEGGQEAVQIVLGAVPALLLALFLVNLLRAVGAIGAAESFLAPVLSLVDLPSETVLPVATKFLAGGTAMMGVTMELLQEGVMSVVDLNRLAGLLIHPFDLVGVAVLAASGTRVASVARPAVAGAVVGVLVRAVLHMVIF
ncbi:MAG: nucleoside recognition family protein [Desulfuromonadales bacterium]|nr:nucleoside recognition family protein [Desulfuromonadales bacterium]NIS43129.1 nucleoside recognition family protein [Desulfuromonadales bacterium]